MADCIKDTCTKLFGELKQRAEEHKTAHKEQQERLAHKRRRQGDEGGDGANAVGAAAAGDAPTAAG
eukprot:3536197-Pyramimonas_sp.AAC.1